MKIGIIVAMGKELALLKPLLKSPTTETVKGLNFIKGEVANNTVVALQCGIGKVNAAIGTMTMIFQYSPDMIINTGVAGGIDKCLGVMDVVAGQKVAYHDVDCGPESELGQVQGLPLYYEADAKLYKAAMGITTETKLHGGLICSGDQFITDRTQLDKIKSRYPDGLAVDMESGALAQVCYLYDVPFLSFRIISDTPGADKHFDQYQNFWGTMADRSFGVTKALLEALTNI